MLLLLGAQRWWQEFLERKPFPLLGDCASHKAAESQVEISRSATIEGKIFHRFEEADGKGTIQFSVAQSYEPGIFVPAAMAQQHFRGLSFFLSLPGAKKPMEAYEAMSEMALVVARKLRADLYDSARSALTPQTIEHDRQQIMEYERRQKLAQKKQARR